jgi:hypothetical protein
MPGARRLMKNVIMCIGVKLNNSSKSNWDRSPEGCLLKTARLEAKYSQYIAKRSLDRCLPFEAQLNQKAKMIT